jgi:hypothetical protein
MTIQKRINELEIYEQLDSGDVGYIPSTAIWLPVDYSGWTVSKKMALDDFLSNIHFEAGRLSNISSWSVSITFGTAFSSFSGGVSVYRDKIDGTDTIRENVLKKNLLETLTGFSFEIDPSESLTGVVVNYNYFENQ